MAGGAICAELTGMFIILLVARVAILRRRLQISKGARIEMTFCASHICVLAVQFKRKTRVSEVITQCVYAIVTGKAICAKSQNVCLGESNIHLTVATVAGVWGEGCDVRLMAILTSERCARRCELVPFQRESQRLMREGVLAHIGQSRSRTAMLRVTIVAGKRRTFLHDRTVQPRHVFHLLSNIGVTTRTAICHRFRANRRSVTV